MYFIYTHFNRYLRFFYAFKSQFSGLYEAKCEWELGEWERSDYERKAIYKIFIKIEN